MCLLFYEHLIESLSKVWKNPNVASCKTWQKIKLLLMITTYNVLIKYIGILLVEYYSNINLSKYYMKNFGF